MLKKGVIAQLRQMGANGPTGKMPGCAETLQQLIQVQFEQLQYVRARNSEAPAVAEIASLLAVTGALESESSRIKMRARYSPKNAVH